MRDIIKLLFSDGDSDSRGPESWDQPGRRARIGDSREWCGTEPGEDALGDLAAALRGRRGRRAPHVIVVKGRRW
jgi:hypothetical protein